MKRNRLQDITDPQPETAEEPKPEITYRNIKVALTQDERLGMGDEIAKESAALVEAKEHKKAVSSQVKETIDGLEARIGKLARTLTNGYEYRDLRCAVIRDYDRKTVTFTRTDTGEAVESRAMTLDEMQRELPVG